MSILDFLSCTGAKLLGRTRFDLPDTEAGPGAVPPPPGMRVGASATGAMKRYSDDIGNLPSRILALSVV